mgnify:CR=1 FL=1
MVTFDNLVIASLVLLLGTNSLIAVLFWLHERLERRMAGRLQTAVEKAVRAVEQLCVTLDCPEKKQQAVLRVQALLGWYKWFIPTLVIDTAIETEVYLIKQLHRKIGVDHDMPEEVVGFEGSE